jgi:hypothetical protein
MARWPPGRGFLRFAARLSEKGRPKGSYPKKPSFLDGFPAKIWPVPPGRSRETGIWGARGCAGKRSPDCSDRGGYTLIRHGSPTWNHSQEMPARECITHGRVLEMAPNTHCQPRMRWPETFRWNAGGGFQSRVMQGPSEDGIWPPRFLVESLRGEAAEQITNSDGDRCRRSLSAETYPLDLLRDLEFRETARLEGCVG